MTSQIMIPLDGSPQAERILLTARRLAQELHSPIVLLGVVPPPEGAERWSRCSSLNGCVVTEARAGLMAYLEGIAAQLHGYGIPTLLATRFGEPGPVIAEFANESQVDLVAMSTRGLVGDSVTRHVMLNASVPVLALQPGNS